MQQQQSGANGMSGGAQQAMQYHARQDAQTRLENAVQVESAIVEVRLALRPYEPTDVGTHYLRL